MIQIQAWQVDFHLGKLGLGLLVRMDKLEGNSKVINCYYHKSCQECKNLKWSCDTTYEPNYPGFKAEGQRYRKCEKGCTWLRAAPG